MVLLKIEFNPSFFDYHDFRKYNKIKNHTHVIQNKNIKQLFFYQLV